MLSSKWEPLADTIDLGSQRKTASATLAVEAHSTWKAGGGGTPVPLHEWCAEGSINGRSPLSSPHT